MIESIPTLSFTIAMIALFLLGIAALLMPIFVIIIASRLSDTKAVLRRMEALLARQASQQTTAAQNPIALRKM